MFLKKILFLLILFFFFCKLSLTFNSSNLLKANCNVFNPHIILPDKSQYLVGGSFSIHKNDCIHIDANSVQEIFGIQYALSYWNKQQLTLNNEKFPKISFSAGNSCSRSKESISQIIRLLKSAQFYEHKECLNMQKNKASLIGIISPKNIESALAVSNILQNTNIPIGVFNSVAAQSFLNINFKNVISTAPVLYNFIENFLHLTSMLNSNLIAIVSNDKINTKEIIKLLKKNNIYISEVVFYNDPLLADIIFNSDANIILSLTKLTNIQFTDEMLEMQKIWVTIEFEQHDDSFESNENKILPNNILKKKANLQQIIIRQQSQQLLNFNKYFMHLLLDKHITYPLFVSYVQQIFNCSINECYKIFDNKNNTIIKSYLTSKNIKNAIKLIYTFAIIAKELNKLEILNCKINVNSKTCYDKIFEIAQTINYRFTINDPPELRHETLSFYKINEKFLILKNLTIETLFLEYREKNVYIQQLFKTFTGIKFNKNYILPLKLQNIISTCPIYQPYCNQCQNNFKIDTNKIFLSNPQQYLLYLTGIFDFHYGKNCDVLNNENIALPLAFIYATTKINYITSKKNKGIEFGAILVDTCSSNLKTLKFLMEAENRCYSFMQDNFNLTVAAASNFGYISASSPSIFSNSNFLNYNVPIVNLLPNIVDYFFENQNLSTPFITLNQNIKKKITQSNIEVEKINLGFSTMPSYEKIAIFILKYLKKMHWEFINVVLDETDADSVASYNEFIKLIAFTKNSICISNIIILNKISKKTDSNANITLLFTSARSAAEYLSIRLRNRRSLILNNEKNSLNTNLIHILIGNAHDFYLYDISDLSHYSGTVSIQPKDVLSSEFRNWLFSITPFLLEEIWFWRYVEEQWKCALLRQNIELYQGRLCTGKEFLNVAKMGRMTKAGYLEKTIKIFLSIANKIYNQLCLTKFVQKQNKICNEFATKGKFYIQNELNQINLEEEYEVYEFLPIDHHGNFGYKLLVNYSSNFGFNIINLYQTYINGYLSTKPPPISQCYLPFCQCVVEIATSKMRPLFFDNTKSNNIFEYNQNNNLNLRSYVLQKPAKFSANDFNNFIVYDAETVQKIHTIDRRLNVLKYIFLILTSIFCIITIATLALIGLKMYSCIVKGNQSLGITLLLGILGLFLSSYTFILDPSIMICNSRIASHTFTHTISFSVLLVKAVQLKNAEMLGVVYGHQISYWNYWLMLIFICLVQVVICFKWLINSTIMSSIIYLILNENVNNAKFTDGQEKTTVVLRCSYSTPEFFLAESYSFLLLIIALFLNACNRNIKRNYKEAKWLFIASFIITLVTIFWIIGLAFLNSIYIDYLIVIELYFTGTTLLIFVFGPKIYVLLAHKSTIVESYKTNKISCKLSSQNFKIKSKDPFSKTNKLDKFSKIFNEM